MVLVLTNLNTTNIQALTSTDISDLTTNQVSNILSS
jgi:hypothetical protein